MGWKQNREYDCLLACIATHVNRTISTVYGDDFRDDVENKKGCHDDDVEKAFNYAGLFRDVDFFSIYVSPQHAISPQVKGLLIGRKAILQVRSLNYEHGSHMIYWDGFKIFDPSNKQVYQWISQCMPEYIFLFDETQ